MRLRQSCLTTKSRAWGTDSRRRKGTRTDPVLAAVGVLSAYHSIITALWRGLLDPVTRAAITVTAPIPPDLESLLRRVAGP